MFEPVYKHPQKRPMNTQDFFGTPFKVYLFTKDFNLKKLPLQNQTVWLEFETAV
jgi:hypothetical protein